MDYKQAPVIKKGDTGGHAVKAALFHASSNYTSSPPIGFGSGPKYNRISAMPGFGSSKIINTSPTASRLDPKGTFTGLPALQGSSITSKFDSGGKGLIFTERRYSTTNQKKTLNFLSNVDLVNNNQVNRTVTITGRHPSTTKGSYQKINPLLYKDVKSKENKLGIFKDKHHFSFVSKKDS